MRDAVRRLALLTAVSLKYCLVSFFYLSAPVHNTPLPPSPSYPSILYIALVCLLVCLFICCYCCCSESTAAILKIVGYVVGGLLAFLVFLGLWFKCRGRCGASTTAENTPSGEANEFPLLTDKQEQRA